MSPSPGALTIDRPRRAARRAGCALALLALLQAGPALARAQRGPVHHSQPLAVVVRKHVRAPGLYSVRVIVRAAEGRANRVWLRIGGVRRSVRTDRHHRHARVVVRVRLARRWLIVRATGRPARPVLAIALHRLRRPARRPAPPATAPPAPAGASTAPAGQAGRATSVPAVVTPTTPAPPVAPPAGGATVYWGAWIGPQFTGTQAPWDQRAIDAFQRDTGKAISLLHFASPFGNCNSLPCTTYPFPAAQFDTVRNDGAIPFFSWSSQALPTSYNPAAYNLPSIINGNWDSYISGWAQAAKAWGHPFFLRFDWEMNGNWFPWSEGRNGNRSGDFVAAWRHVHDIFTSVGATNATWVWCPNVDAQQQFTPLSELYPGNGYVDWTCLDVYNFDQPWLTFSYLFTSTYTALTQTIAPSKPVIIGETASTEQGGSKAQWITAMFSELPTSYPNVHGLIWMDNPVGGHDWPIESSASATAAFDAGIANPRYATNVFSSLDGLAPLGAL